MLTSSSSSTKPFLHILLALHRKATAWHSITSVAVLVNKWDFSSFFFFLFLHKRVLSSTFSVCSSCIDSPKRMKSHSEHEWTDWKKAFKIIWEPFKSRLETVFHKLRNQSCQRLDCFKFCLKKCYLKIQLLTLLTFLFQTFLISSLKSFRLLSCFL